MTLQSVDAAAWLELFWMVAARLPTFEATTLMMILLTMSTLSFLGRMSPIVGPCAELCFGVWTGNMWAVLSGSLGLALHLSSAWTKQVAKHVRRGGKGYSLVKAARRYQTLARLAMLVNAVDMVEMAAQLYETTTFGKSFLTTDTTTTNGSFQWPAVWSTEGSERRYKLVS